MAYTAEACISCVYPLVGEAGMAWRLTKGTAVVLVFFCHSVILKHIAIGVKYTHDPRATYGGMDGFVFQGGGTGGSTACMSDDHIPAPLTVLLWTDGFG
jgi:hypothetical protein